MVNNELDINTVNCDIYDAPSPLTLSPDGARGQTAD